MDGKTALRYALITGGLLYAYVILHQFLNQGETPLINMLISLVVFMVIIAPGFLLNVLAYRFNNRFLALLAGLSYLDSGFKFILTMLILLIPAGFCFYAFYALSDQHKINMERKKALKNNH
jgi:predicted membrane protein